MQMLEGKLQPMAAYTYEQMKVYGDANLLNVLPFGVECRGIKKKNMQDS